jgi:hypothetical protein
MAKANRKRAWFVGMLAAISGLALLYTIGTKTMSGEKVDKLTANMKTACVGRFLIDLPEAMDFSYSHTFIYGFWLSAIPESNQAFLQRVATREAEINAQPNERGEKNMEKVEMVSVHGLSGKLFTFGRTSVEGLEKGKTVFYVNVALEGYVHADNVTFVFKTEDVDPNRTAILGTIIEKLRVVAPNEIPSAPGFCFGRGMLVDPIPIVWTEGVALFAGFREHPDLALAFNTRAGVGPDPNDPGLLRRNARADAEMPLWQKPLLKKLRIGHRSINGIDGAEVLERGIQNFVDCYVFDWEADGTKENAFVPAMHLEISTGHSTKAGSPPVPSFVGGDALIKLWDKISSSIRVRPTKPGAPANTEVTPSRPKRGDSASAGDICPESGWWQCTEGRNGDRVLGGQRQFLRKGQRMPQALLLPQQTAWERIRRVQSGYETTQPTSWTLVDLRTKARAKPGIPLAPAIVQVGTLAAQDVDHSGTSARVGSFVRTGTLCPASGWWQCQDSDALDGTRWFAKGDLLPAATFRIAKQKFLITRDVAVFQRRSTWQLLRPASGPGEHTA